MIRVDTSLQSLLESEGSPQDIAALQHALTGESVIDWRRLHVRDLSEVEELLRLNRLDLGRPDDLAYVRRVHGEAVDFAGEILGHAVLPQIAEAEDLRSLFLLSSGSEGRTRADACMVLKIMNVIRHLDARELRLRLPLSDADLGFAADSLVYDALTRMASRDVALVQFEGGLKARRSLLLKLMTPDYRMAYEVPDRVRYRLVVGSRRDVVRAVRALLRDLLPFNVVVPGQSRNDLIPLDGGLEAPEVHARLNPFSSARYRVLSLVADLPIRATDFFDARPELLDRYGPVVFATVEVQIVDEATFEANETGEASHARYKARQRRSVLARLAPDLADPDEGD